MNVKFRKMPLMNSILLFIILLNCVEKTVSFLGHCPPGIYEYNDHSSFTSYVLLNDINDPNGNKFQAAAIKEIVAANLVTDSFWSWQVPQNHYLNEKIEEAFARITKKKKKTIELAKAGKYSDARVELGGALHTVQDFWAHSNWVESQGSAFPDYSSLKNPSPTSMPCKDYPGRLMGGYSELTSAYFYYNHLYLIGCLLTPLSVYMYVQQMSCFPHPHGKCRHGAQELACPIGIHKDCYEYDKVNFPAAARGAREATKRYVQEILDELDRTSVEGLMGVPRSIGIVICGYIVDSCKDSVLEIIQKDKAQKRKYVLVAYSTYKKVTFTTYDKWEFINKIENINGMGGEGEPVFAAILSAVRASTKGGSLFVYTDEESTDKDLKDAVIVEANSRDIFTFFLVGPSYSRRRSLEEGGGRRNPNYDFLEDFVDSTKGELYLRPPNGPELTGFVTNLVSTKSLGSLDLHSTWKIPLGSNGQKIVSFNVDSSVSSLSFEFLTEYISKNTDLTDISLSQETLQGTQERELTCTNPMFRDAFFCYLTDTSPFDKTGEWLLTIKNDYYSQTVDLKIYVDSPIQINDVTYFYRLDENGTVSYTIVPDKIVADTNVTVFIDLAHDVGMNYSCSLCSISRYSHLSGPCSPEPLEFISSYDVEGKFGSGEETITTFKGVLFADMESVQYSDEYYVQVHCEDDIIPISRTYETPMPITGVSVLLYQSNIMDMTVIETGASEVYLDLNLTFVVSNFMDSYQLYNVILEVQKLEDHEICEVSSTKSYVVLQGKEYTMFSVLVSNKEWNFTLDNEQSFDFIVKVASDSRKMLWYSYFVNIDELDKPKTPHKICSAGYYGVDCDITKCYGIFSNDSSVCSTFGECSSLDECTCEGYFGDECEFWECDGTLHSEEGVCSGRGDCLKPDYCVCESGYYNEKAPGFVCQWYDCGASRWDEESVCNYGNGSCDSADNCTCNPGYFGDECDVYSTNDDPDSNPKNPQNNVNGNNEDEPAKFPWIVPVIIVCIIVVYCVALILVPVLALVTCLTLLLYGGVVGGVAIAASVGIKRQKAKHQKTGDGDMDLSDVSYRKFDE